jgi:hypothetical protein
MAGQPGFCDADERLRDLSAAGDPLERLARVVDFEQFRPDLQAALARADRARGGRPPYDAVLMFKVLVLQTLHTLSDDATEYQLKDRLSFMRFCGLSLHDPVPDAKTIWLFREQLTRAGAIDRRFGRFDAIVLVPGDPVDADRRSQLVQRPAEQIDGHMVKECGEPDTLVPSCRFTYAVQCGGLRFPSSAPGTCCPGPHCPWPRPFPPSRPQRRARRCSATSSVLGASPTSPGRPSSDDGCDLADADRPGRTFPTGQPEDLPVPLQAASTRARGLGPRRAGLVLAIAPQPVLPSAYLYSVGTLDGKLFAAQYPAHEFPCQRFAVILADANA